MNRKVVQADLMLLLTAIIWGFAWQVDRQGNVGWRSSCGGRNLFIECSGEIRGSE